MRNYILFSPNEDITSIAVQLSEASDEYNLEIFTDDEKEHIIKKAASLSPDRYDLAIARGMMVNYVKSTSPIPVVEMRMTSQEMIALIQRALGMLQKDHPKIAIIGSMELFPDISSLSGLFQSTISVFYISSPAEVEACVAKACEDGYDMLIGGAAMCEYARSIHMSHLNLSGSQDSLLEALRVARQICDASDMEKKNRAEISVLLDYSVNGIIKVTTKGILSGMNRIASEMLELSPAEVEGQHISRVIPSVSSALLHQVIDLGMSIHSLFLTIDGHEYLCNFIPLTVDRYTEGAILSLQAVKTILNVSSIVKRDLHQKTLRPTTSFGALVCVSDLMKKNIQQAKILSLSDSPVLIYGEDGTEREELAECIHMESDRCDKPFVHINCKNHTPAAQRDLLLGYLSNEQKGDISLSPFSLSDKGTLLLQNVDSLSRENQEFLYHYMTTGSITDEYSNHIFLYDVRIIATACTDLRQEVSQGSFCPELYFIMASMSLGIAPLRRRRDDLAVYIQNFIKHYSTIHSRLNTLSEPAKKLLTEYPWPGNLPQLSHFCERLVLFSPRKIIGAEYVSAQLSDVFPLIPVPGDNTTGIFYNEESKQILELLEKYHGNKSRVAQQLAVSRSTLWRKLKKYGLDGK